MGVCGPAGVLARPPRHPHRRRLQAVIMRTVRYKRTHLVEEEVSKTSTVVRVSRGHSIVQNEGVGMILKLYL